MNISENILAIDVHAHYGTPGDSPNELVKSFMTADAEEVAEFAKRFNTEYSIVSPLAAFYTSSLDDVLAANLDANKMAAKNKGLYQWVVVNPLMPETFTQAKEMLEQSCCVGMKIHPELHGYEISEYGDALFSFAAECHAVVKSHTGGITSQPMEIARFANEYPEVRLILSHLGYNYDNDVTQQVRAIQKSIHENVFTDTSSSRSIYPTLIEWAVKEVGADRILFGTDSPLYFAPMQRVRIDRAKISEQDKRLILRDNALLLFHEKLG